MGKQEPLQPKTRPCRILQGVYADNNALFHAWERHEQGGRLFGLLELADGSMITLQSYSIQFTDKASPQ